MKPIVPKKRALYFIFFTIVFFALIPIIVLYSIGYRFTENYTLDERGGIYVFTDESGAQIFIDDTLQKITGTFQKELFLQNLVPQSYRVLVAHNDYWPWAKEVLVVEKEVSPLYPLLVPKDITPRPIVQATSTSATSTPGASKSEYARVVALFQDQSIATTTATSSHMVEKKHMKIWLEGNNVFAEWTGTPSRIPPYFCVAGVCDQTLVVFSGAAEIRDIAFYPDRDDALIISVADGVFAMEIDTRTYHNFYPLYKGVAPETRVMSDGVFVKDGVTLIELIGF